VYSHPTDQNLKSHNQIKHSPKIVQLQQDLLNGVKSPECNGCWRLESSGIPSLRTRVMHRLKYDYQQEFDVRVEQLVNKKNLKFLWINSGSVCNLACRSCSHVYSSSLFKEHKDRFNKIPVSGITKTDISSLIEEDYSDILEIMILGGEPFLNLEHVQILDEIVCQGHSKQAELKYFTNGTIKLPYDIERNIPHFKQVMFQISIDAIDTQFEYIRTNGKWSTIVDSFAYFSELQKIHSNLVLSVQITISALNVMYLDELLNWLGNFNIETVVQWPVSEPSEYTFKILNQSQKDSVVHYLKTLSHDVSGLISHVEGTTFDPIALEKFHSEVAWTESYKGLALQDYLPRLVDLLKS
jgi:MoaA/NifB/PqqE/SkfB family radical SAM enzyme